jgi:hypothetical protein
MANPESAKSLPNWSVRREADAPLEAAKALRVLEIEMVGTRGFEPRTPTVSR